MYKSTEMYICINLQKCIYVCIFRNVFMYKSTEMYICIFLQKCIYVYIYRNVYMYISTEMYICIHLQNCKYVYIYRNVYTTINTNLHKCIMYIPQRGNSGVSFNYTLLNFGLRPMSLLLLPCLEKPSIF